MPYSIRRTVPSGHSKASFSRIVPPIDGFEDMTRDEALVFKTHDSDPGRAHCVPHVAFDNPFAGANAPPRASIEMRGIALWFD